MNHREVLGVSDSAGKAEIKQAFRNAAKELHPDHSDSPEATEAFKRIKEAHDALIKEAEQPRENVTAQRSAAHAAAATTQATYMKPEPVAMTDEELARVQNLDDIVRTKPKRSLFKKAKESNELKRHRNKLKTNERRMRGLY